MKPGNDQKMLSLTDWYSKYARAPLIVLVIAIVAVQLLYLYLLKVENDRKFSALANAISDTAAISLAQKNRVMLESLLPIAAATPEFVSLNICENERPVLSFPPKSDSCRSETSRFWEITEERQISGFEGYHFVIVRRVLDFSLSTVLSFAFTLIFTSFATASAYAMTKRFRQDILRPIKADFEEEIESEISEFKDLKTRLMKLLRLESEKAEAEIARQVAHDIRSPLSALNILLQTRGLALPVADLELMQSIYSRIYSISENLLSKTRIQSLVAPDIAANDPIVSQVDRLQFLRTVFDNPRREAINALVLNFYI